MNHSKAYINWTKLGAFISNHMIVIVPLCLVLGIFAPDTFSPLRPAIPTLFALMTFQNSLANSIDAMREAIKHPLPIVITLVWAHVAVPLIAFFFGRLFFGYDFDIIAGIVLGYCVPIGATTIMWVSIYEGSMATALTTLLISSLITPFTIPLTLQLLLGASVQVNATGMLIDMMFMVAIPAVIALVVNEASHGWGKQRLSPALAPAGRLCMVTIITVNSTAISSYVRNLTPELVAILVFVGLFSMFSFAMGLGLGKLLHFKREQFVAVVFGSGMRNISAGAVLAMQYFPAQAVFPVMAGVLFQQFLAAAFGKIMKRVLAHM